MQSLKEIFEPEFIGMNNRDSAEVLGPGFLALAQGCLLGTGEIINGPGTDMIFDLLSDNKILGGISTNSEIYVACNEPGDSLAFIYRFTDDGEPVVVSGANLTADKKVEFVNAGTAVYVMNGTDAMGKLVGDVYTTVAGAPVANFGAWLNNRLYALTTASRLWYSNANDPDTFGGSDYIDIFPSQKSPATALSTLGGVLVIGKQDNIITFNGFTTDDFTVKSLTEAMPNYGITSHRSVVNTGDDLYFMSFAGDVPHIRSLVRTSFDKLNFGGTISGVMEGTLKNVNKARLSEVAGGFDGRYMWWSMPSTVSLTNDIVICKDTFRREADQGWTIHDEMNASVFLRSEVEGNDELYFGTDDDSKVYKINKTTSIRDNDDINFEVRSRAYRPAGWKKSKFKYLYVTTGANTDATIQVDGSPDGYTFEDQGSLNPSIAISTFPITFPSALGETSDKKNRIDLKGNTNAYSYQYKITKSTDYTPGTDPNIVIKEWSTLFYPRGLRDAK